MKLQDDLSAFVGLLISNRVEFLIVGAHALAFHGYPRFTGDLDIWVRASGDNADRVLESLADFGFANIGLQRDDLEKKEQVIQLGRPPNRIDILTSISGVDFDEAWTERVAATLGEHPVAFLSKRHLIANKRATGRPKDLADADAIDT